ncbi:hypothetical protein FMN50_17285 [Rhodobacterales bacterium]|nr:hypothetical protein FMN50_17285 [Rhodobacterales bacterium]
MPTTNPELALASDELTDLCDRTGATAIWTAWKGDPHADHQNTAELARTVVDKRPGLTMLSYPIWGRFAPLEETSLPRPDAMHLFDSRSHAKVKSEVIEAHQTQMTHLIDDDPEGFTMPGEMQAHFLDFPEIFIEEH